MLHARLAGLGGIGALNADPTLRIPGTPTRPGPLDECQRRALLRPRQVSKITTLAWKASTTFGSPPVIHVADLPLRVTDRVDTRFGARALAEVERAHVLSVLESCDWNVSHAAEALEVDRGTLYNKLKKYGVQRPADG